jgi:acetylglutamate kinase
MLTVLKLGGELLEDAAATAAAARATARLKAAGPLVVVHGGGRAIDADLRARSVSPRFVDGLRVTDADTLATVVGVLAGRINTALVAALNAAGVRAVGLTAADADVAVARLAAPLQSPSGAVVDLGLVGDLTAAEPALLHHLIAGGYVPVVASIGATREGTVLNVNADVLASHLAAGLGADRLIVAGATAGVLDAGGATCDVLSESDARALVASGAATAGMIAKLDACVKALDRGVKDVRIVSGRDDDYESARGTTLVRQLAGARVGIP